eukprot:635938-Amphidinium_carterae.1
MVTGLIPICNTKNLYMPHNDIDSLMPSLQYGCPKGSSAALNLVGVVGGSGSRAWFASVTKLFQDTYSWHE